jgi:integrase/recombinase XerC
VNRKVACLRSYYKSLFARVSRIEANPMLRIKAPEMARKLPGVRARRRLNGLPHLFESGDDFASDQPVLEMLVRHGIRLGAHWRSCRRRDSCRHRARDRQGNKQRLVPLNPTLKLVIERYQAGLYLALPGPLLFYRQGRGHVR